MWTKNGFQKDKEKEVDRYWIFGFSDFRLSGLSKDWIGLILFVSINFWYKSTRVDVTSQLG